MVTLDVKSLYTNIPMNEGLHSAARALVHNRDRSEKPSTAELIQLLRMVLTYNNFEFNGDHYLQISGTVLGTCVAPSFAKIVMSDLEENKLLEFPLHLSCLWCGGATLMTIIFFASGHMVQVNLDPC